MERGDRRWGEVGGREKGKWGCNSWEVGGGVGWERLEEVERRE